MMKGFATASINILLSTVMKSFVIFSSLKWTMKCMSKIKNLSHFKAFFFNVSPYDQFMFTFYIIDYIIFLVPYRGYYGYISVII